MSDFGRLIKDGIKIATYISLKTGLGEASATNFYHSSAADLSCDRIVELLKQLFWKQNRYAFNNSQYGHKESEPRDQSREETTPIRQINSTTHVDPPVQVVSAQVDLGSRQYVPESIPGPCNTGF